MENNSTETNQCIYDILSSMNREELEGHFKNNMNNISKSLGQLRLSNINISHQLEEENFNQEKSNLAFDNLEATEYYIDEFFYDYKIVKEKIVKARLMKIALDEKTKTHFTDNIHQDLVLLGCKKIKLPQ